MNSLKISIIVVSYTTDRFKDLVELLDSIQSQTYHNTETLLVVDRSPELYRRVSSYLAERSLPETRLLYQPAEGGISAARNLAIRNAIGDIIAFTDDDAILFPDWAEEMARVYTRDTATICVTGPALPLWEQASMDWFPQEYYWVFSCTSENTAVEKEVRNGYGNNLSFRREAFDIAGLFNVRLGVRVQDRIEWQRPGAEETELSLRVRRRTDKRIIYSPRVRVKHKVYQYRLTTGSISSRAYWEGYAKAMLKSRYRPLRDEAKPLATEHKLLRRILFRLLPHTLANLLPYPRLSLRRLWITMVVLSCVAGGFISYQLTHLRGHEQSYDAE